MKKFPGKRAAALRFTLSGLSKHLFSHEEQEEKPSLLASFWACFLLERDFPKPEWEKLTKKYEEVSGKEAATLRFTLNGLSKHLFSHEEQEEKELLFHIVWFSTLLPSSCFFFFFPRKTHLQYISCRRETNSLLSEPSLTGVLPLKRRKSRNFFIYQSEGFFESQKAMVIYLRYSLSQFTERHLLKPEWEKLRKKYEEVSGKEAAALRFTLSGLSKHLFSHEERKEKELHFPIVWGIASFFALFFSTNQKAMVIYLRYSLSQFTERHFPKPEWEKLRKKYEEVSEKKSAAMRFTLSGLSKHLFSHEEQKEK
ncbi:hypothetical protein CEXT_396771 [Caerostris extrusa]|uniref:Uncharacterized protein n=1 Tax=Caerostris extrusa TaxID=172846 RepID=A0AAV4XBC2_CAEEX|nr:hypothetical protein CEXT_396771 [Caerostris extrusa]